MASEADQIGAAVARVMFRRRDPPDMILVCEGPQVGPAKLALVQVRSGGFQVVIDEREDMAFWAKVADAGRRQPPPKGPAEILPFVRPSPEKADCHG